MQTVHKYEAPDGRKWRCERWGRIEEQLSGVTPADLPRLHAATEGSPRAWRVLARLGGLRPTIPPMSYDRTMLEFVEPDELAEELGLKRGGLAQEWQAIAGLWLSANAAADPAPKLAAVVKAAQAEKFTGEFELKPGEDPLQKYGFDIEFEHAAERANFLERLHALRKPLEQKGIPAQLARNLLLQELKIGRYQMRQQRVKVDDLGGDVFLKLERELREQTGIYMDMLRKLNDVAPWEAQVGGGVSFNGAVADLIRAMQFTWGQADASLAAGIEQVTDVRLVHDRMAAARLVDGVFTGEELQVALRVSRQSIASGFATQYRPDVVALVNEAQRHLLDQNYKPTLRASEAQRLLAGWQAGERACREDLGVAVPDLLEDGPEGEHPKLVEEFTDDLKDRA
jgi:hypothetical protein